MNILPKKRWHVRTKENIARVRKDEAEAAEKEKERLERLKLAETEARTSLLRQRAKKLRGEECKEKEESKVEDTKSELHKHVNFFEELEAGEVAFTGTNKDYEKEKKEDKEKYEKQIGYLTYLGQDTVESTGKISWYNKTPERLSTNSESTKSNVEVCLEKKSIIDPLNNIRHYLELAGSKVALKNKISIEKHDISSSSGVKRKRPKEKKKRKRCKDNKRRKREKSTRKNYVSSDESDSNSSDDEITKKFNLEKLRAERVQREAEEKLRAERHLAKFRGESEPPKKEPTYSIKQKYNSQFNPHIARQNFTDDK